MKCPKCNKEFTSKKVYWIHVENCNEQKQETKQETKEELTIKELRKKAAEQGVKNANRMKKEDLVKAVEKEVI